MEPLSCQTPWLASRQTPPSIDAASLLDHLAYRLAVKAAGQQFRLRACVTIKPEDGGTAPLC